MPFELILLLGAALLGVLLGVMLLCINGAISRRAKGPDMPEEDIPLDAPEEEETRPASQRSAFREERVQPVRPAPVPQTQPDVKFAPLEKRENEKMAPVSVPVHAVGDDEIFAQLGSLRVRVDNAQSIGQRGEQQDAFAITSLEDKDILQKHGVMAVVADGMGGLDLGTRAANTAAVQFMRSYLTGDGAGEEPLRRALDAANEAVCRLMDNQNVGKVGTTLAAAVLHENGMWFVSVGDSHIYLHRNDKLYQLNRDHNYYSELLKQVEAGQISLEEARRHPERAHLTSYLGQNPLAMVDANVQPVPLRAGDKIVLCTDGLFKTLPAQRVQGILSQNRQDAAQALLAAVEQAQKPHQDNATVVVLYLDRV